MKDEVRAEVARFKEGEGVFLDGNKRDMAVLMVFWFWPKNIDIY